MTQLQESIRHDVAPDHFRRSPQFKRSSEEIRWNGGYQLIEPRVMPKPEGIPANCIGYNPTGLHTLPPHSIDNPTDSPIDVMILRVEPNRVDAVTSHLGKSVVRAYMINLQNLEVPMRPFHGATEFLGEDASLIRIRRRLPISGKLEKAWLHSSVYVQPKPDKPYEVASFQTLFRSGTSLNNLEIVAEGPPGMKDIRNAIDADPDSSRLHVWPRPQPYSETGNVSYMSVPDLSKLTEEAIANAPLIHKDLYPEDSGVWGGVGEAWLVGNGKYVLASHQAWMTGPNNSGKCYEGLMFGHNTITKRIVELGVIAAAAMFPGHTVKDDMTINLNNVVFPGGGHNGKPELLTFGVGDGSVGIGRLRRLPGRHR